MQYKDEHHKLLYLSFILILYWQTARIIIILYACNIITINQRTHNFAN